MSPTHIYPGPVGVDIKCSMSLLQLDLPADQIEDRPTRRKLIEAVCERIPTGPGRGQRNVKDGRKFTEELGRQLMVEGASESVCTQLGIPPEWASRCEDSTHLGHNDTAGRSRTNGWTTALLHTETFRSFDGKISQLGSYGGGNHFGECEIVHVEDNDRSSPWRRVFLASVTMAMSPSFRTAALARPGHKLGDGPIPRPCSTSLPTGTFPYPATTKSWSMRRWAHPKPMLISTIWLSARELRHAEPPPHQHALVLEAFQQVFPGPSTGQLVYFISHNISPRQREVVNDRPAWRSIAREPRGPSPANSHALTETIYEETGHPILLPGNPQAGSVVMVADASRFPSCYSVNHGAGRTLGHKTPPFASSTRAPRSRVNRSTNTTS